MIVLLNFNLVGQIINQFFEIWQRGNVIEWFAYTKTETSKLLKVTSENYLTTPNPLFGQEFSRQYVPCTHLYTWLKRNDVVQSLLHMYPCKEEHDEIYHTFCLEKCCYKFW